MGLAASRQEAFWEACGFGHILRVKKFLEAGDIDVNWVSYTHDCCPIHVASQGKTEIVRLLIEAKCNVNVQDIRGNTPLHHAAMKGHGDIIKILVEAGAEVNVQDKNDWTALHCACYWNHSKAVRVLLNLGADITLQNKDKRTALLETARSQEKDDESLGEITHMLIAAGSDLNCKGCSDLGDLEADFTGLMYAAYHNHPDVASALIEGGCQINAYGSNLWTALHWAADRGHEEMVYLLLGSGADPTKRGQRNELAADRAESPELKEMLHNAVNMFNELATLNPGSNAKSSSEQKPKLETESNYHEQSPVKKDILSSETVKQKDTDVTNNKESIQGQDPGTDICDQVSNLNIDSQETTSIETESRKSVETNTMLTEESSNLDLAQKTEESDHKEKDISEDKIGQTEVLST
ncbi:ankyrin repeat, SAM and basic leucine zipper domain-containing protein 1-like [Mytilus trossulus]|uniref:ankyrin repeat, SAM and basic leucine zipper domain-containing protein 1-like n=1 Tax=Mytilus trossulus TaxID=6551 RepID=UPI0030050863